MEKQEEVNKIWEKIQKLLALQQGAEKIGSIEEAANAAEKIQRLLLKYNLNLSDLDKKTPKAIDERVFTPEEWAYQPKEGLWVPLLISLVSEFFLCRSVNYQYRGQKRVDIAIMGKPHNIEVAYQSSLNLISAIRYFGRRSYATVGKHMGEQKRGSYLRAYYMGAVLGLSTSINRIRSQREFEAKHFTPAMAQEYLPMRQVEIVAQREVEQYMQEKHSPEQKKHKAPKTSVASVEGYTKGRELSPQTSLG